MKILSITMKRIGVSFVWYYNEKYRTTGHLFQGRFKSENVETYRYLFTVIRYIHQNPVKAGMSIRLMDGDGVAALATTGKILIQESCWIMILFLRSFQLI